MKRYVLLLIVLLGFVTPHADAQGFCITGTWYAEYNDLVAIAQASIVQPDDTDDVLVDKTIALFSVQFVLEAMVHTAPDCAISLIRKTAKLVALEANVGMFVVLYRGGALGISETDAEWLIMLYNSQIQATLLSVQHAAESLDMVPAAY